jgi:hypothetical protein
VLLEPARLFIDHLEMIREKTRGNLTTQEAEILNSVLTDLQMAFVQASSTAQPSAPTGSTSSVEEAKKPEEANAEPSTEAESKKKFSKSYGA